MCLFFRLKIAVQKIPFTPQDKVCKVPQSRFEQQLTTLNQDILGDFNMLDCRIPNSRFSYITELSSNMFDKLQRYFVDPKYRTLLLRILPELDKAFAIKIPRDNHSREDRYIMFFVHTRHQ
jgi:hypothetical protein